MLESFLVAGRQDLDGPGELAYGQSITDGCIGWETTVEVLDELADAVRARASRRRVVVRARMRIAVIGVGLIGGSIALAARERLRRDRRRLRPVGARARARAGARRRRPRRRRSPTPSPAPRWCSWRCRSARSRSWSREALAARAGDCVVTDVGSTKRASSPRTTIRGSSAATRWPGPRTPASSTPARTCSTARPGT